MRLPRLLAWIHLVYGLAAMVFAGLGGVVMVTQALDNHGCAAMATAFAACFLIAMAICGLPQAFFARRYLRGHPHGARSLAWLSIVNLALNLATAGLFAAGGVPLAGVVLLPALAVNVLTLLAMRRERNRQDSLDAPGA
jgi:formate hydrogenlyase subunit 3/multisubunit Na+/H+ antiporter MnhD subunit